VAQASSEPQPDPLSGLSTPELLERAVANGKIDRDTADLYLAYALSTEHERVPDRYVGAEPWEGTFLLLNLQRDLSAGRAGRHAREIGRVLAPGRSTAANDCGSVTGGGSSTTTTTFYIDYTAGTIGGRLTIGDYKTSLQAAWDSEVGTFGWAAPPLHPATPGGPRYHVVIAKLDPGLYGFVSAQGRFAGLRGNNPNTPWDEGDAYMSCMVLNRNYAQPGFSGTPRKALNATTSHEFNHSIQFGYGALLGSGFVADQVFVEGGATWMEDEVFDAANDNYHFLWPIFPRDMGTYSDGAGAKRPYPYWVIFRAITERFGTGVVAGGERIVQRYWEAISRGTTDDLAALNAALVPEGHNLPNAYHSAAVALRFNKPCSGGYVYPYCLEEGPRYVAAAGPPPIQGLIDSVGGGFSGAVRDNYALNWVKLPSTGTFDVVLTNTSSGGLLRTSVACDTGTAISVNPLPVAGAGGITKLQDFSAGTCKPGTIFAVITNQSQTAADPPTSTARSYTLRTARGSPPKCPGFESDARNQVVGSPEANPLFGSAAADIICGLGGNDTLSGFGGNDLLLGGLGVDTLHGGEGADVLNGGDGSDGSNRDTQAGWGSIGLFGNKGNDRLIGDLGTDDLFGGPGRDRLEGGAAWDILVGTDGRDTLLAGEGNDELRGNAGIDSINGGTGFDRAVYIDETGPVNANLSTGKATGTGIGTDTFAAVEDLFGTARADTLTGNGGSNFLFGHHGNDRLVGGAGNDALFGQKGNDAFNGGPGNDRCVQGLGSGTRRACESFSITESPGRVPAGRPAPIRKEGSA
jgi:RTX calcium-binding nonapeptide repeat (4 copies)